jgi:hypothetical protein
MKISFTIDGQAGLRKQVEQFSQRRIASIMATALTRTAVEVRAAVQEELPRVFDRPTPYTVRQLRYVAATAQKPVAAVGFNVEAIQDELGKVIRYRQALSGETPAEKYINPNIRGGQRSVKRFEKALQAAGYMPAGWQAVPGKGARLDAFGNVSKGQIIQVLSQLRVTLTAGSTRNLPVVKDNERKVIRALKKAGGRYFVIKPGAKRGTPGVYQRDFYSEVLTPIFIFVKGTSYRPRFDFDGIAGRVAAARLQPNIARAIGEQLGRLGLNG